MAEQIVGRGTVLSDGSRRAAGPPPSDVRERSQYRAECRWHRWYGSWRTSRAQAVSELAGHNQTCTPEFEMWSEEVTALWREAEPVIRATEGVNLSPADLRVFTEEQRLALLLGIASLARPVGGSADRAEDDG